MLRVVSKPDSHLGSVTSRQCYDELKNALAHPRHRNVTWSRTTKRFTVNVDNVPRYLPGVHSLLDVLCPLPDKNALSRVASRAKRKSEGGAGKKKSAKTVTWEAHYKKTANEIVKGMEGGTIVHEEMEAYCAGGRALLSQQFRKPHAYTMAVVEWMEKNGMVPLFSEWKIYDELHLGFATFADMIVWNTKAKSYELWDFKTGYDNVFCVGNQRAAGPLRPYFDNSNLSRALMQVMLAKMALKYRYDIHVAARVVLVNENGVRSKVLSEGVIGNLHKIYMDCAAYLKQVRKNERLKNERDGSKRAKLEREIRLEEKAFTPLHTRPKATRTEKIAGAPSKIIRKK